MENKKAALQLWLIVFEVVDKVVVMGKVVVVTSRTWPRFYYYYYYYLK